MSVLATKEFWVAAGERALSTAAQTAIGVLTAITVDAASGAADLNWDAGWKVVAIATALSVLKSVAVVNVGNPGPATFGPEKLEV